MDTHIDIPVEQLTTFRHMAHQHPEVSGEETNTRQRVIEFLTPYAPDEVLELGEKSIGVIYGSANDAKTILIRCELDALPIMETTEISYKSVNEGVAHSCGHDGHMTIVAGLGAVLHQSRPENTRVILLFQHAEEIGAGAQAVVNDPVFQKLAPDYVVALHNVPGYPLKQVVLKKDSFTPSVVSIAVELQGKTSHAAEPEKGINPALAVSKIIAAAHNLEINEETEELQLLTPIQVMLGEEAYGTSAGHAEVKYTLRTWTDERLQRLKQAFTDQVVQICKEEGLSHTIRWEQPFSANQNDPALIDTVKEVAQHLGLDVHDKEMPFKWGEDFGLFTQQYKGALLGLGAGTEAPALHNPDYNFPDELIETGVQLFFSIIQQLSTE